MTLSGVVVGLVSLFLGVGPYNDIFFGYFECPPVLLVNLLPPLALAFFFYGLTRRASVGFLLNAGLVLTLSVANYYKLAFRDDPLMFADLLLIREAWNMTGRYRLFLGRKVILALALVPVLWLLLRFFVPGRPRGRTRGVALLLGLALAVGFYTACQDNSLYFEKTAHFDHLDSIWSSTQQYIARGFLYPFFHSAGSAVETAPEGYSSKVAQAMLDAYPAGDIPEEQKVNVVGIMLEAFQDFSRYGTPELSRDVYADYHALEAESYRGDLITNIFGAGTVDTERCFLTGYSHLQNFRGNVNAYPWYFRSQGYQTTGMHPSNAWFYNRVNINEHLGFQDYLFIENFLELFPGDATSDDVFFPVLMGELSRRQVGKPIFSFSVTYQGHGPYSTDPYFWSDLSDFFPADCPYTLEEQQIMANYFGGVENTSQNLVALKDFLAEQEEPYLLVVFGDHSPWMGDGNSIYKAMGLNLDQSTQEGFRNYYATRYLIWANDPAKAALGNDFVGEGPDLAPYFLMNELFRLCGWEGPSYLQATNAVAEAVPVQHTSGIYLENGRFTSELTPEGAALSRDYSFLQYYERRHFRYTDIP